MKKQLLYLLAFSFLVQIGAFGQAFERNSKVASLGIGIGSSLGSFDYSSQLPALSLMYEQGIAKAGNVGIISLGGYLGYKAFSYETSAGTISSKSKWNYTIIGAKGALHFTNIPNEKLDLYAGLMASYNFLGYSYEDNSGFDIDNSGNFSNSGGLTIFGGARYYFYESFAAFGELGYGVAFLNLGISVKL